MPKFIVEIGDDAARAIADYASLRNVPLEAAIREVVETWATKYLTRIAGKKPPQPRR